MIYTENSSCQDLSANLILNIGGNVILKAEEDTADDSDDDDHPDDDEGGHKDENQEAVVLLSANGMFSQLELKHHICLD